MDGLNKTFMRDPASFMRRHPIQPRTPETGKLGRWRATKLAGMQPPETGVHEFDLSYDPLRSGLVFITLFEERFGKLSGRRSHPISAYWLPWESEHTAQITLGDKANYFFTSALGGCRMQIAGSTVLHIAGNRLDGRKDKTGSLWRDAQAKEVLGSSYAGSRRFSSTQEYRGVENAFFIGYKSGGSWKFLAQGLQFDEKGWHIASLSGGAGGTLDI
jgi:hypothetical protein